ncbi:g3034 [Coccomyxa elongata]
MASLRVKLQWFWLLLYAVITIPFAPFVASPIKFFRGGLDDDAKSPGSLILLASSVSISWVFAKSIQNASTLGAQYGLVGCLAYAGYYTSFASVGIVIYFLRTRKGYRSLPEAINQRYGPLATLSFGLAVLFRLYQEVWSNAVVVAPWYGPLHSKEWWLAATLSTSIPVIYSFSGGMRASIMTDTTQLVICVGFFIALLAVLGSKMPTGWDWNPSGTCALPASPQPLTYQMCAVDGGAQLVNNTLVNLGKAQFTYTNASCNYPTIKDAQLCTAVGGIYSQPKCSVKSQLACGEHGGQWNPNAMWSLHGGVDLLIVALLQGCLSYPFFDPVLTDRAFLAKPTTMLGAFLLGGVVAALFIFFFGFVGIYGNAVATLRPSWIPESLYKGTLGGLPPAVTGSIGKGLFQVTNIIFVFESLSTLDSTFTSAAKLLGPEFAGLLEDGTPKPPQTAKIWHLTMGRIIIIILAVAGLLPLIGDAKALDATTVSGTIVLGLGPPIFALMFVDGYRPLTFHLPFWWGVGLGVTSQLSSTFTSINMSGFKFGNGANALLLGTNVIGSVIAWALMFITLLENPLGSALTQEAAQGNNFYRAMGRLCRRRKDTVKEGSGSEPPVQEDIQQQHGQHLESAGPTGGGKAAGLPGPEERV